jgi:hypothetical protein
MDFNSKTTAVRKRNKPQQLTEYKLANWSIGSLHNNKSGVDGEGEEIKREKRKGEPTKD